MEIPNMEYVDWKGRRAEEGKQGGRKAAVFVWVVEVLENMAFISPASGMVTYFVATMHYPMSRASNMLTNYMGTSFLLTLLGGFVSDSFLTRFWTIVASAVLELVGLILMTIQSRVHSLRPSGAEDTPSARQAAMLYVALYAMAAGVGGIKSSLAAHGADQLDRSDPRAVSSFFNWFFFSLCCGGFLAVTILAWVQDSKGWPWAFAICAAALFVGLGVFVGGIGLYRNKVPTGSPFTRILKVLVSAARNRNSNSELSGNRSNKFRFLDKATNDAKVLPSQVEEAKVFLRLLPIFLSTIMMNCCLAQLNTFSIYQGVLMDRRVGSSFSLPVPSLLTLPLVVMLISVPLYQRLLNSLKRPFLSPLRRIGMGLILASLSMATAAIVEARRRSLSLSDGGRMSVFWLGWQYLLLGVSDMFTLAGMLEFFYSEAPEGMRSLCTSLSWCSTSMGYFLSSVIVTTVDACGGWLRNKDMDKNKLDYFYMLLCVLNFINFLNYVIWAMWY